MTTPLTLSELPALRALAEKATPGPWEWWTSNSWRRLTRERDEAVRAVTLMHENAAAQDRVLFATRSAMAKARDEALEQAAQIADLWTSADNIRLHAGEMDAQEVRSVKACVRGVAAAIRAMKREPAND